MVRTLTLALLAATILSGCTHSDADKGLCPTAAVLAPTSALTVFRQNAPADPSGELYTVWMTNVKIGCDYDKDSRSVNSRIHVMFSAKRPPASEDVNYRVPYFVTVTHGGNRIMTKKLYLADVHFAAGEASTSFEQSIDDIAINFERGSKLGEYQILTGIQLTQAQLDYNIKNHHYAP
jgi:hypothetical protein